MGKDDTDASVGKEHGFSVFVMFGDGIWVLGFSLFTN